MNQASDSWSGCCLRRGKNPTGFTLGTSSDGNPDLLFMWRLCTLIGAQIARPRVADLRRCSSMPSSRLRQAQSMKLRLAMRVLENVHGGLQRTRRAGAANLPASCMAISASLVVILYSGKTEIGKALS